MARKKNGISVVKELALRLVKLCVGEEIWQYEHDAPEGCDMSLKELAAALRLARELELRDPEATVVRMSRAKCIIRVTADVARTMFSKKAEKVSAEVKLEKWEDCWDPNEVSLSFRREHGPQTSMSWKSLQSRRSCRKNRAGFPRKSRLS